MGTRLASDSRQGRYRSMSEWPARSMGACNVQTERRKHRRLPITLPVAFSAANASQPAANGCETLNVSTGGVYFRTEQPGVHPGQTLDVSLTIPPGQGHFPYEGRIATLAEVTRVDRLRENPCLYGVAAQFHDPPKLSF